MKETTITPKVFISYSWSTPEHDDWILILAKRLMSDGIEVVLDKWDLKKGHDTNDFMESMVKSKEIDRVLIISDSTYTQKAEERKGGVGTEAQIISPQIYADLKQEKFIPVVKEIAEDGRPCLPTFLKGRLYIDMSSPDKESDNYEGLIRTIYNRPLESKPSLGKMPSYLDEGTPITFHTSSVIHNLERQLERYPDRVNTIFKEFWVGFSKH